MCNVLYYIFFLLFCSLCLQQLSYTHCESSSSSIDTDGSITWTLVYFLHYVMIPISSLTWFLQGLQYQMVRNIILCRCQRNAQVYRSIGDHLCSHEKILASGYCCCIPIGQSCWWCHYFQNSIHAFLRALPTMLWGMLMINNNSFLLLF